MHNRLKDSKHNSSVLCHYYVNAPVLSCRVPGRSSNFQVKVLNGIEILIGHSTLNKYHLGQMLSCCKKIQQFSDLRNCIILLKSSADERPGQWDGTAQVVIFFQVVPPMSSWQYFLAFPVNHHYLESSLKQIHGPHFQSFWFITPRVEPERFISNNISAAASGSRQPFKKQNP